MVAWYIYVGKYTFLRPMDGFWDFSTGSPAPPFVKTAPVSTREAK